jgi:2'-5' RNA ligase
MLTYYAEKMDGWKQWQREYQYGVILIFPPEPHLSKITALRNQYRWTQSSECDAHISLTVEIPQPMLQAHLDEITEKLSSIDSFCIQYGPLIDKPIHPGVMLRIAQQDKLKSLIEAIETASLFTGAVARTYPFFAHMTIAETLPTMEQTYQIINELKDIPLTDKFLLTYVSYAVPDENFAFTERLRIRLGK